MRANGLFLALVLAGCRPASNAVSGSTQVIRATQALAADSLTSINGSYGAGCLARSGSWSLRVAGIDPLLNPDLSVVTNNAACLLTVTSLVADQTYLGAPSIALTTAFQSAASAFAPSGAVSFYANAKLDSASFANDFVVTALFSDDPTVASSGDAAFPQVLVVATSPLDLATDVGTFRKPTATFNRAMDPSSIPSSFTLKQQGAMVSLDGVASYDGASQTAIFRPTSALLTSTTYVATITTAAKDTLGHGLASDFSWTFTTAAVACGMSPVLLASVGSFGVFAGSTITSTGPTSIGGDIGVSPGTAITGFGPGVITGTQHTGTDPVAAQAAADLTTAIQDAAQRSTCFITIVGGELGGRTLTPGLYRSDIASFTITDNDLILDGQGDSEAVFVLQALASTLTVTASRQVTLIGQAKASNVFWLVGSSATIGANASINGTLLAGASISMGTGATINGRALASSAAVTLLSNTITVPQP